MVKTDITGKRRHPPRSHAAAGAATFVKQANFVAALPQPFRARQPSQASANNTDSHPAPIRSSL
jgi:hypothetical protein